MLPVWLGADVALKKMLQEEQRPLLQTMMQEWPFFRARIELLEMIFLKTDASIVRYYEELLVPEELNAFRG